MCPAVTFAPLDKLFSSLQYMNRTCFLVGIHSFLYYRYNGISPQCISTYINTMQVTTAACQKETVVIPLPDSWNQLHIALFLFKGFTFQVNRLIFPRRCLDFFPCTRLHIEQIQMIFRHTCLSRHLILISFQSRTWLRNRVNHPQRFHIPLVHNNRSKIFGVGRPVPPHFPTFSIAQRICVQGTVWNTIPKIRCTIRCQTDFYNRTIFLILTSLLVIGNAHIVQIAILGINHTLAIRRYRRPIRLIQFLLFVFQVCQLTRRIVIREIKRGISL